MSGTHHHHHGSSQRIGLAFLLNAGFAIIEVIGGIWTGSAAILADAVHDLGDCTALGLAWLLERKSRGEASSEFSYGYRRLSLLSAVVSGVILLLGSLSVLAHTLPRLSAPDTPDTQGMLGLAILGILVNGIAAWRMRGAHSMNERVVSLHLMEDVLGWVAIAVASVVMMFWELPLLDPLLAVAIALWVIWQAVTRMRETVRLFLQATPPDLDLTQLQSVVLGVPGVEGLHHAHVWTLDGEQHIATMHLVVAGELAPTEIAALRRDVRSKLRELQIGHATLEVEAPEDCECTHESAGCRLEV